MIQFGELERTQVKVGSDLKPALIQLQDGDQVNEPLQRPRALIYGIYIQLLLFRFIGRDKDTLCKQTSESE